ncbi:MAG: enoyl-CoA hydratase/isomerase family protein [Haloarculaceae archaeon]
MADRVRTAVADGRFTITMDCPERDNALTRETYRAMIDALAEAEETDARCVVLEGAGDAFSTGADIEDLGGEEGPAPPLDERVQTIQDNEHSLARDLVTHPLPTVAKVDGPAIGDGACFALACDVPLASERARIGFSHARFALSMDCAGSYVLPRLLGRGMAMELALTGRIVDGERAHELGLVNHVYPDDEFEARADELVDDLATGAPVAQRHIKRLIRRGYDRDLEDVLEAEATSQAIAADTEDYDRAAEALRNGEQPTFEGR